MDLDPLVETTGDEESAKVGEVGSHTWIQPLSSSPCIPTTDALHDSNKKITWLSL